jgi:cellulose synthase (UDP-forming)
MCGTNCVLRRSALKKVGGFARSSIAEDVATGMMIESKGFEAIAIDKVLARGEAVNNYAGFLRQRSRWGRGCIQTGRNYGIFSMRGLKLRQKFDYFTAISYWFFGVRRLFYMILPLLFAYFGIIAIEGDLRVFMGIFLAQYILKRFVIDWAEGGYKSSTWMKIFETIQAPYMAWVVLKESVFSSRKFEVTRKGANDEKKGTGIKMALAHFGLLALNGGGIATAILKMRESGIELYLIPVVWMVVNSVYLSVAIIFDLRRSHGYANFEPGKAKRFGVKTLLSIIWREREKKA